MKKISLIVIFLTLSIICSFLTSCNDDKNTDPSVSILKTEPAEIYAGGVLSLLSAASDADGDEIAYSYEVSSGTITGTGVLVFWNMPSTAGSHKITVKADDGKGWKASTEKTITLLAPVSQISGIGELQGSGADLKDSKIYLFNVWPTRGNPIKILQYRVQVSGWHSTSRGFRPGIIIFCFGRMLITMGLPQWVIWSAGMAMGTITLPIILRFRLVKGKHLTVIQSKLLLPCSLGKI
ncbi:MAG: hypothetical protein K0B15_14535 [Lentimicrobium sp.]|nr:hypothetical protein [Lentimicrobium sp.]